METRKQANYALKIESVKNRIVCSNMYSNHTSATPKILKIRTSREFVYLSPVNISYQNHVTVNFQNSGTERKSFCFWTESSQLSSALSQRLYLALY